MEVLLSHSNHELLFQGAEAKLFKVKFLNKDVVIKYRFQKKYRHSQLDKILRNNRIIQESRNLVKCYLKGINCPNVYFVDVNNGIIIMDYIPGETLNDYLNKLICDSKNLKNIIKEISINIGLAISNLHNHIIHGDLTASNIIISNNDKEMNNINFIDFGLSYCDSLTIEDKAVDLYVLERSLEVTHPNLKIMDLVLDTYLQLHNDGKLVINKFREVRSRGRKKD